MDKPLNYLRKAPSNIRWKFCWDNVFIGLHLSSIRWRVVREAFIYLSCILLVLGVTAFIVGLYFIRVEGFKVYYKDLVLTIPVYEVSTKWPGNYSEVVNIPIYIVEVRDKPISETWNYTYSISIPWSNCTGGKDIFFALRGYRSLGDVPPYVAMEVYGCTNNVRQLLLSSDTVSLSDLKEGELLKKVEYSTAS